MRRTKSPLKLKSRIFRRKDGRFATELRLPSGERKPVYGKTAEEVERKALAMLERCRVGLSPGKSRTTVGELLDAHLAEARNVRTGEPLSWNSRRNYGYQVGHLKKALGKGTRVADLTPKRVQSAFHELQDKHGPVSCHSMRKLLRAALKPRVGQDWPQNPAENIVLRPLDGPKVKALSAEDARRFLKAARGHKYEAHYVLMLLCGLRIGEAMGLQWADVDFKAERLTVKQQLQEFPGGERRLVKPKTRESAAPVEIPRLALEVLQRVEVAQKEARLAAGEKWRKSGLVCANEQGHPVSRQNVRYRLRILCKEHGLPEDMTPHRLRDSTATVLVELDEHAKVVQSVLRHSKFQTTMDRYVAVDPKLRRRAANKLDEALG